jgi:tetratricopeptide (TPR) repeat protein
MLRFPPIRILPKLTSMSTVFGSRTRQVMRVGTLAFLVGTSLAHAQPDPYADVSRLVRAGQLTEAMAKADQYLASKPRDPQMRFIKGVIQSESGKMNEAIATFSKLTEDFPELPEPYNNLAVLYAAQGQFDKARSVLEMAIRTHPSYATAHENLGDVYAKLASQAYSKALQLDAGNAAVSPKLSLIRSLFSQEPKKDRAAPATPVAEAKPSTRPAAVPTATPGPAAAPAVAAAPAAASAAVEPRAPAPAKPTAKSPDQLDQEVSAAVQAWAKAWSDKDMNGYLGAYAGSFTPPSGQTRSAWEADRKARILPRSRISVVVSDLNVSIHSDGQRASVRFRQAYNSDNISVNSRKTLDMVKVGNRWQILRESTGS